MSSEISKRQMVIVTRLGTFWVDIERAENIRKIKEDDPQGIVDIDNSFISLSQVYGMLTPEKYAEYQNERRGMWQCTYKHWHPRQDNCTCARDRVTRHERPRTPKLTPEEREKASKKLDEMRKRFGKRK